MTYTDTKEQPLTIEGIEESAIVNYFATINREEFELTAELFAEAGELLAPFEKPIIGKSAIASYLTKEAKGMQLLPKQGEKITKDELEQIKVRGKVKTPLFSVNVAWYFSLNAQQQITQVQIELLASPQELLGLQSKKQDN